MNKRPSIHIGKRVYKTRSSYSRYLAVAALAVFTLLFLSLPAVHSNNPAAQLSSSIFHPNIRIKGLKEGAGTVSSNWAGYAVSNSPGTVSNVAGSFTLPRVSCSKKSSYVAFWAGLDGYNSATVEQAGVLAECFDSKAYYSAWTEFYPSAPTYASWTPSPGDKISVTTSCTQTDECTATVTDGSKSYSNTSVVSSAALSSAECITERPTLGTSLSNLANFGTAYYGQDNTYIPGTCYATVSGTTLSFGASSATSIDMLGNNGQLIATTSPLSSDGSSFNVLYTAASSPPGPGHKGGRLK